MSSSKQELITHEKIEIQDCSWLDRLEYDWLCCCQLLWSARFVPPMPSFTHTVSDESDLYERAWWIKKKTAVSRDSQEDKRWNRSEVASSSKGGQLVTSTSAPGSTSSKDLCFSGWSSLSGPVSWILICRHVVPLLWRSCPGHTVTMIVHVHKESLGVIVIISKDNFAITTKLDSVWLVVKLIEDQLSQAQLRIVLDVG